MRNFVFKASVIIAFLLSASASDGADGNIDEAKTLFTSLYKSPLTEEGDKPLTDDTNKIQEQIKILNSQGKICHYFVYLQSRCSNPDIDLQTYFFLGLMHEFGLGTPQDYTQAFHFYDRGSKDARSRHALGWLYQKGLGLPASDGTGPNYVKAFGCYESAANEGYPPAINSLANLLYLGLGCEKDPARALELYHRSMNFMNPSQVMFNFMLRRKQGIKFNYPLAMERYQQDLKSAKDPAHKSQAAYNCGMLHLEGSGCEKNPQEAFNCMKRAAENSSPSKDAMRMLACMYRGGIGTPVDLIESQKWKERAQEQKEYTYECELDAPSVIPERSPSFQLKGMNLYHQSRISITRDLKNVSVPELLLTRYFEDHLGGDKERLIFGDFPEDIQKKIIPLIFPGKVGILSFLSKLMLINKANYEWCVRNFAFHPDHPNYDRFYQQQPDRVLALMLEFTYQRPGSHEINKEHIKKMLRPFSEGQFPNLLGLKLNVQMHNTTKFEEEGFRSSFSRALLELDPLEKKIREQEAQLREQEAQQAKIYKEALSLLVIYQRYAQNRATGQEVALIQNLIERARSNINSITPVERAFLMMAAQMAPQGDSEKDDEEQANVTEVEQENKPEEDPSDVLAVLDIKWRDAPSDHSNGATALEVFEKYPRAKIVKIAGLFETFSGGKMNLPYVEILIILGERLGWFDFERSSCSFTAPKLRQIVLGVHNPNNYKDIRIPEKGYANFLSKLNAKKFPNLKEITIVNDPQLTGAFLFPDHYYTYNPNDSGIAYNLHIKRCPSVNFPNLLKSFTSQKKPVEEVLITEINPARLNANGVGIDVWRDVFQNNPQLKIKTDCKEANDVIRIYEETFKPGTN